MAVCGCATRSVSLIIASRTGVSDSQASRGIMLRCEDKERDAADAVGGGFEARRASISAFALALHSGCPPKNVNNQDAYKKG